MMRDDHSPSRENPFDRELFMDERHFAPDIIDRAEARQQEADRPAGGAQDKVEDWELGLSSEFYQPSDHQRMGLTRLEELSLAIETCKEMVVACSEHSEKRRKLVAKLVQLRLKQQELKEGPLEVTDEMRVISGHNFTVQDRSGRNPYCERCLGIIWRLVQPWYRCQVCGYRSHAKCLNIITRICAGVVARESGRYILDICPEKGLGEQQYRCAECRVKLSFEGRDEPRQCDYNGKFYCSACHWNDLMIIPARVVRNWDFVSRPVCRSSKQLLELLQRKAIVNLQRANSSLFSYLEELRLMRKLRSDILIMKCYFMSCKSARSSKMLWHLKRHHHFVEGRDLYSIQDLIELQEGRLEAEITAIIHIFSQHIKRDCECCKGNGFFCELCSDKTIIFPFDDYVSLCRICFAVYHRRCFEAAERRCTRCERRRLRRESTSRTMTPSPPPVETQEPKRGPSKSLNEVTKKKSLNPFENDSHEKLGNSSEEKKNKSLNPFEESDYDDSLNPFSH